MFITILMPLLLAGGPVSKFDNDAPALSYVSSASIYDIERCVIDMAGSRGAPLVYRQPDRPDEVRFLWNGPMGVIGRLDLKRSGVGTQVVAWIGPKGLLECAPKG